MASSKTLLFGTSYGRHRASGLRIMLDGAALPYKTRSTKATLLSTLKEFEKSLNKESLVILGDVVTAYYKEGHHLKSIRPLRAAFQSIKRDTKDSESLKPNQKPNGLKASKATKKKQPGEVMSGKRKRQQTFRTAQKSEVKIEPEVTSKVVGNNLQAANTECCICWEVLTPDDFPKGKITANCKHELNVCSTCATSSIDAQVDIGPLSPITCPLCAENLLTEDVRRLSIKKTFEKYNRLTTLQSLNRNPEFYRCLKPGCESGQYHDGSTSEGQPDICNPAQMICSVCGFATCVQHGIPWHTGKTCAQYTEECEEVLRRAREKETADRAELAKRQRTKAEKAKAEKAKAEKIKARKSEMAKRKKVEEAAEAAKLQQALDNNASLKTVARISKSCPGSCGAHIQKIDGCSHMICTECGLHFCWVCLKRWDPNHFCRHQW